MVPVVPVGGAGVELPRGPRVDEDPVAAWVVHCDAVQAVLDEAIDRFYTADVSMHTWDLARATGQDDRLDPDFCAQLLAGMVEVEDAMRASGQYGKPVAVPDDADTQSRLLGFIGRDPQWTPAGGLRRRSRPK